MAWKHLPLKVLLPVGVGLIVAVTLGLLFLRRLDEVDRRFTELDERFERAIEIAEQAAEQSAAAYRRAEKAQQRSRAAIVDREAAEAARAEAEIRAETALDEATSAQQVAEAAQREAIHARAEAARIRRERDAEMNRLQKALGRIAETQRTAMGLVLNLDSNTINFAFDRARLLPEDRETLSRIAGVLLTSAGYRIHVYGHTDDVGTEAYNQKLSHRRAEAVQDHLIESGIDPDIITTQGFGKTSPLVAGTDPEARAKNRRVELGIIDVIVDFTETVAQP